jgi:hypothetical protein
MKTVGLHSHWRRLSILIAILVPLVGCDLGAAATDGAASTASQNLAMFVQDFARQLLAAFLL